MHGDAGHQLEDDGDAVRTFEALRDKVVALRRGVELVHRQGQQAAPSAPDCGPTLGQMEQALQAIAGRLETVERQPALTLTPARFRSEIDSVASGAVSAISRPFIEAVKEARAAARDLDSLTGRLREGREQRTWLLIVGHVTHKGRIRSGQSTRGNLPLLDRARHDAIALAARHILIYRSNQWPAASAGPRIDLCAVGAIDTRTASLGLYRERRLVTMPISDRPGSAVLKGPPANLSSRQGLAYEEIGMLPGNRAWPRRPNPCASPDRRRLQQQSANVRRGRATRADRTGSRWLAPATTSPHRCLPDLAYAEWPADRSG